MMAEQVRCAECANAVGRKQHGELWSVVCRVDQLRLVESAERECHLFRRRPEPGDAATVIVREEDPEALHRAAMDRISRGRGDS